jgi:hypothetical protein
MAVTDETLRLINQLRDATAAITDSHTRDLVKAYANAWDEVAADLDAALLDLAASAKDDRITAAQVRRSTRVRKSLAVIGDELTRLADEASILISGDLDHAVDVAGKAQAALTKSQMPPVASGTADLVVDWAMVDDNAIRAIVERSTEQIHAATRPMSGQAVDAMKRELVRGIAGGSNPNDTARRMLARCQGVFEGGSARAVRISRTETLDAMREAGRLSDEANTEVVKGWVWMAQLSSRTCPACWGQHGTEHAIADPGPLGHQNCRCARSPLTKTWKDLGFDIEEPKSLLPDAETRFGALSKDKQVAVLGQARFDAWKKGDYPMSSWASRRETSGWRDSYVVSALPKSA